MKQKLEFWINMQSGNGKSIVIVDPKCLIKCFKWIIIASPCYWHNSNKL